MKKYIELNMFFGILSMILAGIAYYYDNQNIKTRQCLDEVTVTEILSLDYRDATIKLSNGNTKVVNQATLKPGDKLCLKFNH